MSGIDKLLDLLDKDIPECKKRLQDSHINLEDVATYCEGNYAKAADKRKALEETKGYMTQSLASVAYQINLMSTNFLQLLDLQVDQVTEMESSINHLSQVVSIHKEKVARREIGELTTSKNYYRPPGVKANGVVTPEKSEPSVAYVRKPIDFNALDNLGISKKPTAGQTRPPPVQRKPSVSNRESTTSLNHSQSIRSSASKPAPAAKRPDAKAPNPLAIPEPPSPLYDPPPPPPPAMMSPGLPPPPMTPLSSPDRGSMVPDSPALPPPPPDSDESQTEDPGSVEEYVPDYSSRLSQMILDDASWIPTDFIEKVVAVYSYSRDKADELSFSEGAVIYVVQKNEDGWWEGVMDGQSGLFPNNYVEPCI